MTDRPVAVVTGASGGIGAATAEQFAKHGYDVVLGVLAEPGTADVVKCVEQAGGAVLVVEGDLTDLDYAKSIVDRAIERFGRIDVLVNNAAWRELVTMRTITVDSWAKTLAVMLTAPAFLSRWAAVHMQRQKRGVIINVSSIQSVRAAGMSPAYVAAKGAINALTNELAVLYGPAGVRVLAVSPGCIDTAMGTDYVAPDGTNVTNVMRDESIDRIPLQRWADPTAIAAAIVMLASDAASYISGTNIVIDGGLLGAMSCHSHRKLLFPEQY